MVKNEHDRLPDALDSVAWTDEVVVVDTGSTDGTQDLARAAGARVVEVPWSGFVRTRNGALEMPRHDWVLFLDADERVTPELRDAIRATLDARGHELAGLTMPRLAHLLCRPVRHGVWYPNVKLRVGRRSRGFRAEGGRVHETLVVDGPVLRLAPPLLHFPYRDISDALRRNSDYARLGADDRYEKGIRGSAAGLLVRPAFEFFRSYVVKAGILDGSAGFAVAFFHASSYFLRAAFLLEKARIERNGLPAPDISEVPG